VMSEYNVSTEQAEDDILNLVRQLMSEGLVELVGESR